MSITTYITAIESSRNTIRNKLVELGMAQSGDKLERLATVIEGLVNQGAVSVTVKEGDTYTIPRGYHNGSGTVSGVSGGGDYKLQSKTVSPTKNRQNITPDSGFFGLSDVTLEAIPGNYQDTSSVTAEAGDVLTGRIFVTADGTVTAGNMINNGAVEQLLDAVTVSYTIPKGYHTGTGRVQLVLETRTVTPSGTVQEITPATGKVLGKVTVEAIPRQYQDVSGVTAGAGQVLSGSVFVDATGTQVEGTMPDRGAVSATIDGLTTLSYSLPAGYHNGSGVVTLTDDIENALAAI